MKYKDRLNKTDVGLDLIKKQAAALRKKPKKLVDEVFNNAHVKAFKQIDCLQCANCCKTTSPIFREIDIKRISKHLRSSESDFIKKYLHLDDEKDYVLNEAPCTFLGADNHCGIYEVRPLACKEYPHTDRKNMYQILDLTVKNSQICPAVSFIFEDINLSLKK